MRIICFLKFYSFTFFLIIMLYFQYKFILIYFCLLIFPLSIFRFRFYIILFIFRLVNYLIRLLFYFLYLITRVLLFVLLINQGSYKFFIVFFIFLFPFVFPLNEFLINQVTSKLVFHFQLVIKIVNYFIFIKALFFYL